MRKRSAKILLVDDEPFILEVASQVLSRAGFETHTCHLWTGVLNTVREQRPDLVLLDYNMPGLRGSDLCNILKRDTAGTDMRVVLYSAEPESDLVRICDECGADGYIRKKSAPNELIRQVEEALDYAE